MKSTVTVTVQSINYACETLQNRTKNNNSLTPTSKRRLKTVQSTEIVYFLPFSLSRTFSPALIPATEGNPSVIAIMFHRCTDLVFSTSIISKMLDLFLIFNRKIEFSLLSIRSNAFGSLI